MDEKLKNLYKKVILQHNKEPYHYEKPAHFDLKLEADNPVCGDRFELFFILHENIIQQGYFQGYGCAISKAATSILLQKIENHSKADALNIIREFLDFVKNTNSTITLEELDKALQAFAAARDFPERQNCVTLSWETLEKYLES